MSLTAAAAYRATERQIWQRRVPSIVRELRIRWELRIGPPFSGSGDGASWVAPAVRQDGRSVVLKIGFPHMEAEHEAEGLRFWSGDPTIELYEADDDCEALLLERCEPTANLRLLEEPDQDLVIGGLLHRLWRRPAEPHPFRPLFVMLRAWARETLQAAAFWPDAGLVREGLHLFEVLSRPSPEDVLLATDLHAGNVLRAHREPWLAIDPKPFVGDRAYDATQHLLNCSGRLLSDPDSTISRFSDIIEVDAERVRRWLFARAAAEPRDCWTTDSMLLARMLA